MTLLFRVTLTRSLSGVQLVNGLVPGVQDSFTHLSSVLEGWLEGCAAGMVNWSTYRQSLQHTGLRGVTEQGRSCMAFCNENHTASLPPYSTGYQVVTEVRPHSEGGESDPTSQWQEGQRICSLL